MRGHNLCFTVFAFAALVSILVSIGLSSLPIGVDLPEQSYLEGRKYSALPEGDIGAKLLSGAYQKEFEKYIVDKAPFRDEVLLGNATLQKACICLANNLYGFYAYHTYYGSDRVFAPNQNAVLPLPRQYSSESLAYFAEMFEGVSDVARENPSKRFVVYVPANGPMIGLQDCYFDLISDPMRPTDFLKVIEEAPTVDNLVVLTDVGEYASDAEFFESYYRTDHHWNAYGFTSAYDDIANALGLTHVDLRNRVDIPEGSFSGSYARSGRVAVVEDVFDIVQDYSSVTFVEEPDMVRVDGNDHHYFYENLDKACWNFYKYYYTIGDVFNGNGSRRAILLTDSYGMGISRALAQNYGELYELQDFYYEATEGSLVARLEEYDPDDVFIIAASGNYLTQLKRIPDYFKV